MSAAQRMKARTRLLLERGSAQARTTDPCKSVTLLRTDAVLSTGACVSAF